MSGLAPDLFQRRFPDLMEMGRAQLPALAREWTDHNAHDPGITLMELLAWVAEAQLYSLSRMRKDERAAYAALLGVAPEGARPARGLIWPDPLDPASPASTFRRSLVIPGDAAVHVVDTVEPEFRPTHSLLFVPGAVERLETRLADGSTLDHTSVNRRGGSAFLPFGERAGPRDVLALTFVCRADSGPLPIRRADAAGAAWAIGVRAAPALVGGSAATAAGRRSPLTATLVADGARHPLPVVADTTDGLLRTGALLLGLDGLTLSPARFTVELRSPEGFPRPPRWLRISPNVVPIEQGRAIDDELHAAIAVPDWQFDLNEKGLRFSAGQEPIELEVLARDGRQTWTRRERSPEWGPDDAFYELDTAAGRVRFGNGINGRIPPEGSQVLVRYRVCAGERGAVARNRAWEVPGIEGRFGVNPDAVSGGAAATSWTDQRRDARRGAREDHALVTREDIVEAAYALPLLDVARAWLPAADDRLPRTGIVTLVALRARPNGDEPSQAPETRRWLEAIRSRLAPRIPLGTRLRVSAPGYADFAIRATLETEPGLNPEDVRKDAAQALKQRTTLVPTPQTPSPREPGSPLTQRDVNAWLRGVDGVRRVVTLSLLRDGKPVPAILPSGSALPRLVEMRLEVRRPAPEEAR